MKILVYVYKSHLQTLIFRHETLPNLNNCLIRPIIRSYTTKTIIPTNGNVDSSDFKISFLKNKCGLSGKPLIRVSKHITNFDSSDQRPESLLELFRTFGFPMSTVTKIISSYPHILRDHHPEKIIKPKLDFLLTISQSQAEAVAIVTTHPKILVRSLANYLIPSLNLLNSITGSYPNTVYVLIYNPYILRYDLSKTLLLNTQFLSTLGVSRSQIFKLLKGFGPALTAPHDKFRNFVLKLMDMGFDLESSYFGHAIRTLFYLTDSIWESKCELLKSFGFSDHEILFMFKKLPSLMSYTDKTINEKTDFFLNKLQWTPSRLASYTAVLNYSLEKRVITRCSVLQVLGSKDSTSESYMLSSIFAMTEKKFIINFVTAHKDKVPGVMEAYRGKLRFDKYTFKQKGHNDGTHSAPLTLVDQP